MADLNQLCEEILARRCLIVASNRGPVEHHMNPEGLPEARRGSGSIVTALNSLSQSSGNATVWIEGFYEKPEDAGPEADADASVAHLGLVTKAIQDMHQR